MRDRINRFMYGRYGQDELARFMLGACLVLIVINLFLNNGIISTVVIVDLVLCYFRMLSRNTYKRAAENEKYLQITGDIREMFSRQGREERKMYHIYRCPSCRQKIRVPRGKGKIIVTCPKCRREFQRRS